MKEWWKNDDMVDAHYAKDYYGIGHDYFDDFEEDDEDQEEGEEEW